MATEQNVAKFIFGAVTDRTKQLRYVATEDIKSWVGAKRETSKSAKHGAHPENNSASFRLTPRRENYDHAPTGTSIFSRERCS